MSASPQQIVLQRFEEAIKELFACYLSEPPELRTHESMSSDTDMTAVIGLSGKEISCSLTISTSNAVAQKLAGSDSPSLVDWLAELSNQLAGRLKNKLTRYNLQPTLSTPAVIKGKALRVSTLAKVFHRIEFKTEQGMVISKIMLDIPSDLVLRELDDPTSAEEGSLQLF